MLPRFATLRDDGELLMSNHLNLNKLPHLFGGPSRRDLLRLASLGALGLPWTGSLLTAPLAAAPPPPVGEIPVFNRFPRMVQEWFVDRLREIERQSLAAKMSLNTKQDAEAYVRSVQQRIRLCFGPDPQKTPLRPHITGAVERGAYKIEKVIFESRPNFLVTVNLYIPKGRAFPLPGFRILRRCSSLRRSSTRCAMKATLTLSG